MIELKTAKRHVESFRFANLDFAPDTDGALALAKMLGKYALSDEHAGAVVAGWISKWPKWPRPSDIKQVCESIADPHQAQAAESRQKCQRCQGSGFISVQGPFGLSAAFPCTHGPETESDRRMGVKLSPAQSSQYRQESRRSDATHVAFMQKRANGELKGFERVTQSDVDALLAHLGI